MYNSYGQHNDSFGSVTRGGFLTGSGTASFYRKTPFVGAILLQLVGPLLCSILTLSFTNIFPTSAVKTHAVNKTVNK